MQVMPAWYGHDQMVKKNLMQQPLSLIFRVLSRSWSQSKYNYE